MNVTDFRLEKTEQAIEKLTESTQKQEVATERLNATCEQLKDELERTTRTLEGMRGTFAAAQQCELRVAKLESERLEMIAGVRKAWKLLTSKKAKTFYLAAGAYAVKSMPEAQELWDIIKTAMF